MFSLIKLSILMLLVFLVVLINFWLLILERVEFLLCPGCLVAKKVRDFWGKFQQII